MIDSGAMERAIRTVLTGILVVTAFYSLFIPGTLVRRVGVGFLASSLGMLLFLGGMELCKIPLAAGYLQFATALGLLTAFLTVDLPSRFVARVQGCDLQTARGISMIGMVVATFLAAWVAGAPPEMTQAAQNVTSTQSEAEVARGRP